MNIYVGNLNYRVKEGDLQQVMEDYGAVSSVKVIMEGYSVNVPLSKKSREKLT